MNVRTLIVSASLAVALLPQAAAARSVNQVPPLAAPPGTVVNVSTEPQLQAAVAQLTSNTTIVLAPGTYKLSSTLYINGSYSNVGIRGATNNRDDVVLVGAGMTNANYGAVPFGIWTGGNVQGVTIANLTVRDVYQHPLMFNGGTQTPRVYNVHLINAGQQFIKSNPNASGVGANNGVVEYSILEYVTTAPSDYTNAVDIHAGSGWIIRHNLFKNIVGPPGLLAGPAILAWNHSSNTITEGNTFLNCARGIAYGLQDVSGSDHSGGIIRNNFFYRSSSQPGDVAIQIADSPNTQVLNNTVLMSGTYPSAIEYRFAGTTGVVVRNNLLDGAVQARDGATGTSQNNVTNATAAMFVNAAAGDLHLLSSATAAIDKAVTIANVTDDWDGTPRPAGAAPDAGADEFGTTSTPATYTISGHVRTASAALSGVTVTLSGGGSATATTDTAGAYSFGSLAGGGAYVVTPTKSGYTFTPVSLTFSALAANQSTADFTATATATSGPVVSLTAPADGSSYTAPAAITVSATASSTGRTISNVQFYAGTTLIGTATTSPYSVTWNTSSAGSYALTALATDSSGVAVRSAARTVTVSSATSTSTPYSGTPVPLPGRVEAENFDNGGEGVAYHDIEAANNGGAYRSTGVDIEAASVGGYDVGWLATGEWMNYTVNVASAGTYTVQLRIAGLYAGSAHVSFSGTTAAPVAVNVPATGGWQTWSDVSFTTTLAAGTQKMKLLFDTGGFNIDYVTVAAGSGGGSTSGGGTPTVTATLTSPVSLTSYTAPATIPLGATATTTSGTITKVDFYNGSTLIGTDTTAPYSGSWSSVPSGAYALSAKATTSTGQTVTSPVVNVTVSAPSTSGGGWLVQSWNIVSQGTFRLPQSALGSTYGFTYAGDQGNGAYGVTFNAANNSLFIGGHPYEQRLAEIKVPSSFSGNPIATALANLTDPFEGKLPSVNPGDPNKKVLGASLVYNGSLYVSGFSFYDGSGTQKAAWFKRPVSLTTKSQVAGPTVVGTTYPGWIDHSATLVPTEWQSRVGGPVMFGGGGGTINSLQSWGPSLSVVPNPTGIGGSGSVAATVLLGYPYPDHELAASATAANNLWSQMDNVNGVVFVPGTDSILFFGLHGKGNYCYGPGTADASKAGKPATDIGDSVDNWCYDPDFSAKGGHAYPYASWVWAYDANDIAAVKAGSQASYNVKPYATWNLDASFKQVQGAAYDPATKRLYISAVGGDSYNGGQPLIHVYQIQ